MAETMMTGEQLFDNLGAGLDEAVARGDLPNPGKRLTEASKRNESDSKSYIKALRTRLVDLGYLEDTGGNRTSGGTDQKFITAVESFQEEVGSQTLKLDGWAGPKSWIVLQRLVSFEDKDEPRSWNFLVSLKNNPAVVRAAWLRLWVMGFFVAGKNAKEKEWKRSKLGYKPSITLSELLENEDFHEACKRFRDFAHRLGLLKDEAQQSRSELNETFLGALFNYDAIIRALGNAGNIAEGRISREHFHEQFDEFKEQIHALARIEFWLLGYDCAPGPLKMGRRRYIGTRPVGPARSKLSIATGEFWEDFASRPEGVSKDRVTPALFSEFGNLPAGLSGLDASDADTMVQRVSEVLKQEKEKRSFIETFENLASSIWDGVKRLAKFIWRVIRGVVSTITNLVRNLARYIASEAREFFHLVVRAVDAVQGGLDYLRNSIVPESLPAPVVIARSAGFDHSMFVDASAVNVADSPAFKLYGRRAECYCAGCVVIGALAGMLGRVAALAQGALAGPLGWLRALLALGRFRASIESVKAALTLLDEHYTVSGKASGALMLTDVA